jgi:exosortase K
MKMKVATLTLAALVMWRLKRYYADAQVDDLRWILGPTARLVTTFTGAPFGWEPAEGYLSRERFFVIEKACAGINFMIAAFGMVAFVLCRRIRTWLAAAAVLVVSVLASYSAAVIVNALRITVAMWLAAHSFQIAWMSAGQLHRFEGIVIYFGGLVALHELARRFDGRRAAVRMTTPLLWYYGMTLAVPLANGAAGNSAAFVEYALFVLVLPLVFVALASVARYAVARYPSGNRPDTWQQQTTGPRQGLASGWPPDTVES